MSDNENVQDPVSVPRSGAGLEPWVIDLLACPVDLGAVTMEGSDLVCSRCGRRYPVREGIPDMRPEVAQGEH